MHMQSEREEEEKQNSAHQGQGSAPRRLGTGSGVSALLCRSPQNRLNEHTDNTI